MLDLLLERGWPELSPSRTELISEAADASLAHALRVQRGAPLMRLEAQLFAAGRADRRLFRQPFHFRLFPFSCSQARCGGMRSSSR